jgi:1-deoxy-D-xylulose-5-phosphate synthase
LQRSFDQILQDIAMLNLHVVLGVDRAGLVGEDGETHHGVFDVGFLRQVPNMLLLAPACCAELSAMLRWAVLHPPGPVAVRYPRGGDGAYTGSDFRPDSGLCVEGTGSDFAIVTYGTLLNNVQSAASILRNKGLRGKVIRLTRLNPLPEAELVDALRGISRVMVVEETAAASGIFAPIRAVITENCENSHVFGVNLGDQYVPHGDVATLYKHYGLDESALAERMMKEIGHEG